MIIKQLAVPKLGNQSFQIRQDFFPKHHRVWHYHEELELVHILKGSGTLFIGDRIKTFSPGDTVLIAAQMPHYWLFEESPLSEPSSIDCIVIHFKKDFGIHNFLQAPELQEVKALMDKAERGLFFPETVILDSTHVFPILLKLANMERWFALLKLLTKLNQLAAEPLTSLNYAILNHSEDQARMNNLMEYIRENYKQKIKLEDLAQLAGLTENSFCRYFKQRTGKTPIQFITEIRIAHACSQLRNPQISLKEICYDSGFNNFVSFHKSFKNIVGITPGEYRHGNYPS